MPFPFEIPAAEISVNIEDHVDSIYAGLSSDFISMPKGEGFVDYPVFEAGYEALKKATSGFDTLAPEALLTCILDVPISFLVLRTMLGFTPPELAYTTTVRTKVEVDQGFARTLDRRVRLEPTKPLKPSPLMMGRLQAMVRTANELLLAGVPAGTSDKVVHRLGKIDTERGKDSLKASSQLGIPYAALLYERFLGRPFAGHRDSVSELVGDALESAIERQLDRWGVSNHKTKRAEKVPGFVQSPDFIIPSWANPRVIIEAKVTEDDGTARDKVTRIINLVNLSRDPSYNPRGYQVVAALAGRGFAVRRQDMRNLLIATGGKVFTLATVQHIVAHTEIKQFATRIPPAEPEAFAGGIPDIVGQKHEALTKTAEKAAKEEGGSGTLL